MPKTKDPVKKLMKKIKKTEESLALLRESDDPSARPTRSRSRSRFRSRSRSPLHRNRTPPPSSTIAEGDNENIEGDCRPEDKADIVDLTEKQGDDEISEDILALLGEAPQEEKFGPEILPHLHSRWTHIIKNGLDKEIKTQLTKKYPTPANCKILDAPKLNPEAQAAAGENVVKRDLSLLTTFSPAAACASGLSFASMALAIEAKQKKVSCAIAALGLALGKLCKQPSENSYIITLVSDAARLLCDYQYCESNTRKHFIMTGLDSKTAREAVKNTEVDQWLFGENFAEKLKASKAIEKTGKELTSQTSKTKKPQNHLNFRGPANNTSRMKTQTQTQRIGYQHYQKRQVNPARTNNYQQKPRYQQPVNNTRRR